IIYNPCRSCPENGNAPNERVFKVLSQPEGFGNLGSSRKISLPSIGFPFQLAEQHKVLGLLGYVFTECYKQILVTKSEYYSKT
ncbi:MAG: hypothetical protein VSS75_008440, partial [Candidatus Parabeggiatoa sp.]|nr:hypothetical protein [Candidatus Parabeggiatoa sp.]